jgi:hypothetical protein
MHARAHTHKHAATVQAIAGQRTCTALVYGSAVCVFVGRSYICFRQYYISKNRLDPSFNFKNRVYSSLAVRNRSAQRGTDGQPIVQLCSGEPQQCDPTAARRVNGWCGVRHAACNVQHSTRQSCTP